MKIKKELIFDLLIVILIATWTQIEPTLLTLKTTYPILAGLTGLTLLKIRTHYHKNKLEKRQKKE